MRARVSRCDDSGSPYNALAQPNIAPLPVHLPRCPSQAQASPQLQLLLIASPALPERKISLSPPPTTATATTVLGHFPLSYLLSLYTTNAIDGGRQHPVRLYWRCATTSPTRRTWELTSSPSPPGCVATLTTKRDGLAHPVRLYWGPGNTANYEGPATTFSPSLLVCSSTPTTKILAGRTTSSPSPLGCRATRTTKRLSLAHPVRLYWCVRKHQPFRASGWQRNSKNYCGCFLPASIIAMTGTRP